MQVIIITNSNNNIALNGYYTAGDGTGHKRKVEEVDDGSGVQLSNGLWANIVHNGEVYLDWYGDYSVGIEKSFAQNSITSIKCSSTRRIRLTKKSHRNNKVTIDLNGSEFYFDENNYNSGLVFNSSTDFSILDKTPIQGRTSTLFEELKEIPSNSFVLVKDKNPWAHRVGKHDSPSYRSDPNIKLEGHSFVRPFYTDYSEEDDFEIKYRTLDDFSCLKNFKIYFDMPEDFRTMHDVEVFTIKRDNFDKVIDMVEGVGWNQMPSVLETTLNTPYHATKMQQEGVYEDFIQYMDSKTEYDRLQRESENQPEGVMVLPVIEEPQPSEKLLAFKEKYLG